MAQQNQHNMSGPGGRGGPGAWGGFQKPKNLGKTIVRLMGYLARRKWPLLIVLVCLLGSVFTNIAGSSFINLVIINNIAGGVYTSPAGLAADVAKLLAIYAVGWVCTYGQSGIMVQLAQRGTNRMRKELFDHMQTLPLSYFDKHPHGELMSRFTNDADNVQLALEQSVVSLFSSILMFVGIVVVMLTVSPLLFLVSVFTIGATFVVFKVFGGRSRRFYQKQQADLGAVNGNIQETIEGLKVIKAFTHEEAAKELFADLNESYRSSATAANFYSTAIMPIAMNIMNIGYALTAAFGGVLSIVMGLPLGSFTLYLNYCRQVGQPMNQISQQLTTIFSALAGAERIFECMDEPSEVDEGFVTLVPVVRDEAGRMVPAPEGAHVHDWAWKVPDNHRFVLTRAVKNEADELVECPEGTPDALWAWKYPDEKDPAYGLHRIRGDVQQEDGYVLAQLTGAVRLSHVDFSYVPDKQILHDVTVFANPGQKIAFVGSTGAGKTTITNLVNRFYEIQDGVITYGGIDVKAIKKDDLRRSLGAVLQDTHLFTGTVMDNIRYGRLEASDDDCVEAAKIAGADSFIRRLPQGYQTMVTGDGANLSHGQRQLLGIARAAVADPPVMILDEATSSIDTRTERIIQKGMDALMEGRTVFVIAHRLSTVRNSNAIMVLEGGRIIERGDHDDLIAQKGRYYQLYTGGAELE
ncbi:MAG TPA: ABC transporter ATP-binding protein/permease [Candidatus Intestinimonas merdavium]|uniref:ABC transporter ATP-binding protein/permease n=1 Tax=Candidatus Intestinimonas merdavium TaxID=2838622 RepID=A0A9D2CDJ4_9FIRM|nr:ABC transporter ATP-binding protein/permease [Candidatus Intestinimonas merdavium]